MRPTAMLAILTFLLSACAARGQGGGVKGTEMRFEVKVAPGLLPGPTSGRLFVILGTPGGREPRLMTGEAGMDATPILGRDVEGFGPGATGVVDGSAAAFPIADLAHLPAGEYAVQAVFDHNRDLRLLNAPENLYSVPRTVRLDPAGGETVALELTEKLPPEAMLADTARVKCVKLRSDLLSEFQGRPIYLRAAVVLPRGFAEEPDRKYPLRVHIGGYGSRYYYLRREWTADDGGDADTPRFLILVLDGAGPLGDPYQVNSDNHGPYGDAITQELIPYVEKTYRGRGDGQSRVLDGGSTGGWVSLALQVFYPDFFNGTWSACPDGVDFRSFQLVDIYKDENAYINQHGFERPARDVTGEVRYTMRHECRMENAMGRGDSWAMSGGQWGAWNATYGPKGSDGRPVPLWDPKTGVIDRSAVDHWKKYDLRLVLQENWATLGPKLAGKLHISVGEADDFFLNNGVHRLDAFLSNARPAYGGTIAYGPGQGHCWMNLTEREMMKAMAAAVGEGK